MVFIPILYIRNELERFSNLLKVNQLPRKDVIAGAQAPSEARLIHEQCYRGPKTLRTQNILCSRTAVGLPWWCSG